MLKFPSFPYPSQQHLIRWFSHGMILLVVAFAAHAQDDFEDDLEEDEIDGIAEPAKEDPSLEDFWKAMEILETGGGDLDEGRDLLTKAAENEFPPAQYFTGLGYRFGYYGFKQSDRKAFSWLRLAAERGNPQAMHHLAQMYFFGLGHKKDLSRAQEWFEKSLDESADWSIPAPPTSMLQEIEKLSDQPQPDSLDIVTDLDSPTNEETLKSTGNFLLGMIYLEKQKDKAQECFLKAAHFGVNGRAGHYKAAQQAALNYAFGQGVEKDLKKANEMLELSKQLEAKNVMSMTHQLIKTKVFDEFAQTDFQKVMDLLQSQEIQTFQSEVADAFAKEGSEDYDIREAIKWYELAYDNGSAWAALKLAFIYWDGKLGERDEARTFEWFEKANELHTLGEVNLAICYNNGIGTEQDTAKAIEIFEKGKDKHIINYLGTIGQAPTTIQTYDDCVALCEKWAEQGDPQAQYLLGKRYENGWGFEKSYKKALKYYRKAAEMDIAPAHVEVGYDLITHNSSQKDKIKGLAHYHRASELGYAPGAYLFADVLYDMSEIYAAEVYLHWALELNPEHQRANNLMGVISEMMMQGERVLADDYKPNGKSVAIKYFEELGLPLSPPEYYYKPHDEETLNRLREQTLKYYEKSNELGSEYAAYNLGQLYYEGKYVEQDFEQAYMYFQEAAEAGHTVANYYLAQMHELGQGVPVTYKDAAYYYRQAALDGHEKSLEILCNYYLAGKGVSRDLDRAEFWLNLMVNKGKWMALINWGEILLERGEYKEARKLFFKMRLSYKSELQGAAYERLARIYERGLGVKPNPGRALRLRKKALKYENTDAMVSMAKKLMGEQNYSEALEYLNDALDRKNAESSYLLGCLYIQGNGVEQDQLKGIGYVTTAAESGYLFAKLSLAIATWQEQEGAPTLDKAIQYATDAENGGLAKADKIRRLLETKRNKANQNKDSLGSQSG